MQHLEQRGIVIDFSKVETGWLVAKRVIPEYWFEAASLPVPILVGVLLQPVSGVAGLVTVLPDYDKVVIIDADRIGPARLIDIGQA